jgi:hypothetical protein
MSDTVKGYRLSKIKFSLLYLETSPNLGPALILRSFYFLFGRNIFYMTYSPSPKSNLILHILLTTTKHNIVISILVSNERVWCRYSNIAIATLLTNGNTNQKRGRLKMVAFDRSPFKLHIHVSNKVYQIFFISLRYLKTIIIFK